MTLIVEDATGLPNAESLTSVAFALTYHAGRGNAAWAAAILGDQEIALRNATDYMGQAYNGRWAGLRMTTVQALDWPRSLVPMADAPGPSNSVFYWPQSPLPLGVQKACADLALLALAGPLNPPLSRGVISEKVGAIEVTYDINSPQATVYRAIDMGLRPFLGLGGGSTTVRLLRA